MEKVTTRFYLCTQDDSPDCKEIEFDLDENRPQIAYVRTKYYNQRAKLAPDASVLENWTPDKYVTRLYNTIEA